MAIQITHKQERGTHSRTSSACTVATIDVSKQSYIDPVITVRVAVKTEYIKVIFYTTNHKTSAFRNNHTQIWVGEILRNHLLRMQPSLEPEASCSSTTRLSVSATYRSIIIGWPPLEKCKSGWRYDQKKRQEEDRNHAGGITVRHCQCHG